jgi:hypothetical protein
MPNLSSRNAAAVLALMAGLAATPAAEAGPYAPAPGVPGSTALHMSTNLFVGWAAGWTNYVVGEACAEEWQTPGLALGPPVGDSYDVVTLGRGGRITLLFDLPICDGPGPDFAVFENGITDGFAELAHVEVSSDGTNFVRFSSDALVAGPVDAYGVVDVTDYHNLAGKYRQGYGTPFDLHDLEGSAGLDSGKVRWVRLIDIVGDGSALDGSGDVIFDPYPTTGSAGFDLDAVGVIHTPLEVTMAAPGPGSRVTWPTRENRLYRIEYRDLLDSETGWLPAGPVVAGDNTIHSFVDTNAPAASRYYRAVELLP